MFLQRKSVIGYGSQEAFSSKVANPLAHLSPSTESAIFFLTCEAT